ncbi:MAG TPA: hypothetical protein VIO60_05275 [Rectinemataceae bacterium]
MRIELSCAGEGNLEAVRLGIVQAENVGWDEEPCADIDRALDAFLADPRAAPSASRKAAVRDMLRYGSYKPAGRAKPSSEYLLAAALGGEFPRVNFPVDAANIESLRSGYPISIVDIGKAGREFHLRRGKAGEAYVFNSGGQEIDLEDLLIVCRKEGEIFVPTANPVRDSMATKIFSQPVSVAAFIYAPAGPEGEELESVCARLGEWLASKGNAVSWSVWR